MASSSSVEMWKTFSCFRRNKLKRWTRLRVKYNVITLKIHGCVNWVVLNQHLGMAGIVSGEQRDTDLSSVGVPDPVVDAVGTVFGNASASAPYLKMLLLYAWNFWVFFFRVNLNFLLVNVSSYGQVYGQVRWCCVHKMHIMYPHPVLYHWCLRSVVWHFQEFKIKKQWHPGCLHTFVCSSVGFAFVCSV